MVAPLAFSPADQASTSQLHLAYGATGGEAVSACAARTNLSKNAKKIIEILKNDPFAPTFEKLIDDLDGLFSRRISLKHRLLYKVLKKDKTVVIISMWSHYGE